MGRTEKSQGLAPPAVRKDIRAKQARHIINKTIPALLASNTRARKGSESSELVVDPARNTTAMGKPKTDGGEDAAYVKRKGQGRRKMKNERIDEAETGNGIGGIKSKDKGRRRQDSIESDFANLQIPSETPPSHPDRQIRIISTDTLTAAHMLLHSPSSKPSKKAQNICILNMASPLRPGGGVLSGATSQEESLCARTTLLPSLQETYYRLPELGGIWSPDVFVFRNALPLGDARGELGPSERWFVDVVSAGMLRFPELVGRGDDGDEEEGEVKRLSRADRALVEDKMRGVLRIVEKKGVRKIVLGAWGCGAYGNPVGDIAAAWRSVLGSWMPGGSRKSKGIGKQHSTAQAETWPNLETVVFAVSNRSMAEAFAHAFDRDIRVEHGLDGDVASDEDDGQGENAAAELRAKIAELEGQVGRVWNPDLKQRLGVILEDLRAQLEEDEGDGTGNESELEEEDGDGVQGALEGRDEDKTGDTDEEEEEEEDNSWTRVSLEEVR